MLDIAYKRGNLAFQSAGCLAIAAGGAWAAVQSDYNWQIRLLGGFLALCLPFVALMTAMKAASGHSAIREVPGGLRLESLYGSLDVKWERLRGIEREVLTQKTALGMIKQDIAHYLVFVIAEPGTGERRFKIQEDLIAVPKTDLPRLFDRLVKLWEQGGTSVQAATRMQPAVAAQPRLGGFGRKGL